MNDHPIQPLPQDVAAKIRSSTLITHLNGVVLELVKNALDANAQCVFVTVDYQRGGCVVEDDGEGIVPAEFEFGGGLGKPHHTSRFGTSSAYGRKGCFLASLSALSLLTITSHHYRHASTNTVMFHHADPVARLFPAPRHHGLKFSDHGTRVTVNDLFGNMPVRVKSRALTLQKPDQLDHQWDDLKQLLVALMISNDRLQKLSVSETGKERKFTIRPRYDPLGGDLDLTRLSSILSQAGLVDAARTQKWHAVSAAVPQLTIHAALSLVPSPSKKVQFISLGAEPVSPQSQANILYSEANRLFSHSDFGTTGNVPSSYEPGIEERPGSLAVNKWPMFYIRIDSVGIMGRDEELPESDKSLQRILDIFGLMINEFLKEHKLRPRGGRTQRQAFEEEASVCSQAEGERCSNSSSEFSERQFKLPSSSRPGPGGHFGAWSRVKRSSSHTNGSTKVKIVSPCLPTDEKTTSASMAVQEHLLLENVADENPTPRTREVSVDAAFQGHDRIPWVDSYTGAQDWVNSRAANYVNVRPSAALALAKRPKTTGPLLVPVLDIHKRPASTMPDLRDTRLGNDNRKSSVFGRSERPTNALEPDSECPYAESHNFHKYCGLDNLELSKYSGKLHKCDLQAARVIGQVDQKFILVEIPDTNASTLVLIDQHAADERCRIERLFEDFFNGSVVQTIEVEPIVIAIPPSETSLFRQQAKFFQSWGIEYTIEHASESDKASISVSALPTLIAERCQAEPEQLIGILRAEIWKRTEERPQTFIVKRTDSVEDWVRQIAGCPQGIRDMLNSRACRTAIMFNDVLSVDECKALVSRLASCVFPFQCAHGRPSMVPLVEYPGNDEGRGNTDEREADSGFTEAFRRWQSTCQ
jgi:DNA mismatch repair protein MLH3